MEWGDVVCETGKKRTASSVTLLSLFILHRMFPQTSSLMKCKDQTSRLSSSGAVGTDHLQITHSLSDFYHRCCTVCAFSREVLDCVVLKSQRFYVLIGSTAVEVKTEDNLQFSVFDLFRKTDGH